MIMSQLPIAICIIINLSHQINKNIVINIISPCMYPIILQEMTWRKLSWQDTLVYRVNHPHSSINTIQRTFETILILHFLNQPKRILVGNPPSINRIHKNAIFPKILSRCPSNHIQSSFGHISMRMMLTFITPMKNTFHRWHINYPRRCLPHHLMLQLTDQVKRDDGVDYLGGIAIQ